jgi:hypothetical protein
VPAGSGKRICPENPEGTLCVGGHTRCVWVCQAHPSLCNLDQVTSPGLSVFCSEMENQRPFPPANQDLETDLETSSMTVLSLILPVLKAPRQAIGF